MKRYIDRVWLRGACILSAMLIGTSMGGAWQTASAAEGQTADLTGPIEAPLAVAPAVAEDLKNGRSVTHVRAGNYTFAQGTSNLVPLDAGGLSESTPFNTTGKIVVTYAAECAVGAAVGSTATWLDIDIEVRNLATGVVTVLPPTNQTSDAFCTSNGTAGTDGWAMTTITGVATAMPLADYVARIRAKIQNGVAGDTGWLGDSSLVVRK